VCEAAGDEDDRVVAAAKLALGIDAEPLRPGDRDKIFRKTGARDLLGAFDGKCRSAGGARRLAGDDEIIGKPSGIAGLPTVRYFRQHRNPDTFGGSAGGAVGLVLGAIVCLLTYLGLITIPTRYLFAVTSTLITLLAAGMAAQAIAFLQQANILTVFDETVWNTSWILSDSSLLGRPLHTLIGYVDQPTAMQLIAYAATLAVILVLMRLFAVSPAQRPRAA
jgi:Iron permease FTR1 family